jgi:hypothetical protein
MMMTTMMFVQVIQVFFFSFYFILDFLNIAYILQFGYIFVVLVSDLIVFSIFFFFVTFIDDDEDVDDVIYYLCHQH